MLGARTALYLHLCLIVVCLAADYHTTPVARSALSCRLCRGEYDRSLGCTLGYEFASTLYDEGSLSGLVALDYGARLNGQF